MGQVFFTPSQNFTDFLYPDFSGSPAGQSSILSKVDDSISEPGNKNLTTLNVTMNLFFISYSAFIIRNPGVLSDKGNLQRQHYYLL